MRHFLSILALMLIFTLPSCQKHAENEITLEAIEFKISGEGGESVVDLGKGEWRIISVINKEMKGQMFGDAYTLDGDLIRKNSPLKLDRLGRLESLSKDRGFNIIQQTPGSIKVSMLPNGSDHLYSFIIKLSNGHQEREIIIEQDLSAGYSFEHIEYYLDEDDRDSIYIMHNVMTYTFNTLSAMQITLHPMSSTNGVQTYFQSKHRDAFIWLTDKNVEVYVPADVSEGKISLSQEKRVYGAIYNGPYPNNISVNLTTPIGYSKFISDITYRHRTVSYRLTMKSNSGEQSKVVEGKWIETSPTGAYEIKQI